MTSIPKSQPLAAAVVAALVAELGEDRAAHGRKPKAGGWPDGAPTDPKTFKGYAIVHMGGGSFDGTVVEPSADGLQGVQVTAVHVSPWQADAIRDRCREALLPAQLAVPGRGVGTVTLVDEQPAREDQSVQPVLYLSVDRYTIPTTPADDPA